MTDFNLYDPKKVLNHPDFKIVPQGERPNQDANISICYNEKQELHLVEKPRLDLAPGQVEVHIKATGICGSDVHFWKHGKVVDSIVLDSLCGAGHESAGIVSRIGEGLEIFDSAGVTEWKVGDRVAVEAGIPCQTCEYCRIGRYNGCQKCVFFSSPPHHGTMTRYHVHPAKWLHHLPDNVSFEEGALIEPLNVALAGIERSGLRLGDPVLIAGAGPIGLVTLLAAKAAGAEPLVITDLSETRLNLAKKLVPSVRTVLIEKSDKPRDVAKRIQEVASVNVRLALECTGFESSIHSAVFSMGFAGTVLVIGNGKDMQTVPFMHLAANEINLNYMFRYANQYKRAIRLVAGGLIDLKPLCTHKFKLEDGIAGFHVASDPKTGAIKVQIVD
ncbi:hypothetical protein E3Q23_02347 [Wallemia mellicola]|uniref:L-arabinitol 4-dehydrogenase n=1 Tax=Wallemia mellicola TaxID=1708541 RepID=A0A4T0TIV1_9BASI|nr:hypothetical protein E3Q23_02347 [Wallemia mellicola]TIC64767.1 L-arabinitol 4-dehydrogenase [Wallemia mellicola]